VKRAGETGSGGRGATGDAGWRAGAWDEQTHKQTQKDEQTHNSEHEQTQGRNKLWGSGRAVRGAGAGRGTPAVEPRQSLMTTVFAGLGGGEGVRASRGRVWPGGGGGPGWPPDTGVRDATARWLLSSCCECGGTLPVSAPAPSVGAGASWLPPSPCSGGAGLASVRGLAGGFSEAGLLLCATEGAGEKQADRAGAPVGASTAWDSDCRLSDENGNICESAGGACLLCIWSCAAPSGLPGPVGADTSAARAGGLRPYSPLGQR